MGMISKSPGGHGAKGLHGWVGNLSTESRGEDFLVGT